MTEIYLIRHGEAEGNVFRRLHGQYDSLLMPRGYQQRACVEKRFENIHMDACFSSDLTRACLTAASIYVPKNLPLQKDARFRELNVGVWEDLPYGYLDQHFHQDMDRFSHDPKNWHVHGSETYAEYTSRFISGMIEAAERYDGGTICIFGHGAVLRGTLMHLFFDDCPDRLPVGDNTAVSRLFYHNGCFTYDYLNDNSHIPPELSTFHIQAWWRKTDNRIAANLFFEPFTAEDAMYGVTVPCGCESENLMTAKLLSGPVGVVALGTPRDTCGVISGMTLRSDMVGRYYADQMVGCAFSHFRRLGCTELMALPGEYPEAVLTRYGFDQDTLKRSILVSM